MNKNIRPLSYLFLCSASNKFIAFFSIVLFLLPLAKCNAQKSTRISRAYNSFISYFNGYYHANLRYKEGVRSKEANFKIPETGFLELIETQPQNTSGSGLFNQANEKCDVIIVRRKNSSFIDDCFFLKGKCAYQKNNMAEAIVNYEHILNKYPQSPLIRDVKIWLAMAYYASNNPYRAREILNEVLNQKQKIWVKKKIKGIEKKVEELVPVPLKRHQRPYVAELEAMLSIQEKQYNKAIAALEKNITYVPSRKRKSQWYFLIGQLYDATNNFGDAYKYYDLAARLNTSNELTFRSKLAIASLYLKHQPKDSESAEAVTQALTSLIKDIKYEDFHDQIYYQFALIELKKKNYDNALKYLQLSLNKNKGNNSQKVLAYYKAGQIYFYEKFNLDKATAYFDSASAIVDEKLPEYSQIKTIGSVLKKYAEYKKTIHLSDSLLALGKLNEEQLNQRIEAVIRQEEKQRQEKKNAMNRPAPAPQFDPSLFDPNNPNRMNITGFYFDNPAQVAQGKAMFISQWGNRPNEDNWRRRNKRAQFNEIVEDSLDLVDPIKEKEKYEKLLAERKEKYKRNVPRTPEKRDSLEKLLINTLMSLAQLYSPKLNMPDSAIKVYLNIIQRFPDSDLVPKCYFAVYTLLSEQGNRKANDYKNIILQKYPKSIFAKILKKEKIEEEEQNNPLADFKSAYKTVYGLFEAGDYETVVNFASHIIENNIENPEIAKVFYMKGYSFGKLGKTDSLVATYTYLIKNFPGTEVATIAKNTLRLLKGEESIPESGAPSSNLNTQSTPENLTKSNFKPRQGQEPIFVLLLVEQQVIKSNELGTIVSNLIEREFKSDELQSQVMLYQDADGKNYHMVYVLSFDNFRNAENFVATAKQEKPLLKVLKNPEKDIFSITSTNFQAAFQNKQMLEYGAFYSKNKSYLTKEN
ncbi:MAG: tetratricopeptide repeat protein [Bacteroidia bacterium]|nr:tetratricopeptide repeat protein [Bacteroidia bacterium]MDW8158574.1 tetratricopeptide repeat protein [Bacteroidia bacterium]